MKFVLLMLVFILSSLLFGLIPVGDVVVGCCVLFIVCFFSFVVVFHNCLHVYTYVNIYVCVYMYICIYKCISVHVYTYMYTNPHVPLHVYIYIYIYIYIQIGRPGRRVGF